MEHRQPDLVIPKVVLLICPSLILFSLLWTPAQQDTLLVGETALG